MGRFSAPPPGADCKEHSLVAKARGIIQGFGFATGKESLLKTVSVLVEVNDTYC